MKNYNLALNLLADKTCDNCCFKSMENICSKRSIKIENYLTSNIPEEKTCMKWRSVKEPVPVLTRKEINEILKACLGDDYDKK